MSKFTLEKKNVVEIADGQSVEVRGLSPNEIVQLFELHRPVMEDIFNRFSDRDPNSISMAEISQTVFDMVGKLPAFAAHVIALGGDAIDEYDEIAKLPFGASIACIELITELTFKSGGGAKKLLGLIQDLRRTSPSLPST